MTTTPEHDFDFLAGFWSVHNRRLARRHVGCTEWDEFPATSHGWSLLDGIVSVDEIRFPTLGFSGCTLRSFDRATRRWSIWWINSRSGELLPPVVGGFEGDRGEFFGEDTDDGRVVQVRFVWQRQGHDAAHWEQAFSLDGRQWETNWMNDFVRTPEPGPTRGGDQ
jgi:hypothetical protein